MTWSNYLFSFQGRINRAKLWLFILISLCVDIVLTVAAAAYFSISGGMAASGTAAASPMGGNLALVIGGIVCLAVVIALVVASIALAVKRLHDRNKSGLWLLVFWVVPFVLDIIAFAPMIETMSKGGAQPDAFMVPQTGLAIVCRLAAFLISIWAFVELYCLRGTIGDNRFGPDPLEGKV
jgi:uncharacterized membrane protein YhaH (DUF805 family)